MEFPRSTFYAQLEDERKRKGGTQPTPKKRGPKPKVSDAKLLRLVKKDLATTPFTGEGYRKVWDRLKRQGVRVGRKRVGGHVVKKGDRFAALEPIAMGLTREHGDVARGLFLRLDNGTQYRSDHFRKQVEFWGLTKSYSFVRLPEANGVAERFHRTLKGQAVCGRIFYGVENLRAAAGAFVELYNREWLIEKNGYLRPSEARAQYVAEHGEPVPAVERRAA